MKKRRFTPRLKKAEEERIARLLSSLPRIGPKITVTRLDDPGREVVFNPEDECSLHPETGARGVYADYSAVTRELLEANFVWYGRRTRVNHTWCVGKHTIGGSWPEDGGPFQLHWSYTSLLHATPDNVRVLDEITGVLGEPVGRHITPESSVTWLDSYGCTGPANGGSLLAGSALVQVGDQSFECIRAIIVRSEQDGTRVEWNLLDDTYLTPDGRIVLTRRFTRDRDAGGSEKIEYNSIEFRHWFNILTDISLGRPVLPIKVK